MFLAFIKVMTILQELKINMFAKIKSHHNNKTLIYSIQMSWCSTVTSFNNIQIAYRNFALKFRNRHEMTVVANYVYLIYNQL